jgi:RNA-directed DNA polymerase
MLKSNDKSNERWKDLPWKSIEKEVWQQQLQIYKATRDENIQLTRKLQKRLVKSYKAKLLAVKKISQDNRGRKISGIDKKVVETSYNRFQLVNNLAIVSSAFPLRRVWIPKPGKTEKRLFGLPTIRDRALQALFKLAIEPEWEAKFEPNNYGFRPGRSCHDATKAIAQFLHQKPRYVLYAEITKSFDKINHDKLLDKLGYTGSFRRQILYWLKSGVLNKDVFYETDTGIPQRDVISPLLANIALHGLEEHLTEFIQTLKIPDTGRTKRRWMERSRKISSFGIIRYADDFVVLHEQKWVVLALKTEVIRFLKSVGLYLNKTKTQLKHTLILQNDDTKEEGLDGNIGFDFIGFTFRHFHSKYRSAFDSKGRPLGHKLLIYPSKEKYQLHQKKLREIIFKQGKALNQEALIKKLNPVISGWSRYFGVSDANSMHILSKMDQVLFLQLQRWAYRRSKKGKKESVRKYWKKSKNKNWIFATENQTLIRHTDYSNPITKYVKVKADSSPFNGETIYWTKRLRTNPLLSIRVRKLLSLQQGKCKFCNVTFKDGDIMEVDHIIPSTHGGKDYYNNLQLLHGHCHDTKTAQDIVKYSQTWSRESKISE